MRFYSTDTEGVTYPSVTTVIHILGNDRLMEWANFMGFKHKKLKNILDESAEYGTIAHELARTIIDPNAPPLREDIPMQHAIRLNALKPKIQCFAREHEMHIQKTEYTMISDKLKVGGTLDMFGSLIYNGIPYNDFIFDWKTAKSVHSTMWLQLGGYYLLAKEHSLKPKGAGIIRLNDDAIRFNTIDEDTLKEYANGFLHLLEFYKFWGNRLN